MIYGYELVKAFSDSEKVDYKKLYEDERKKSEENARIAAHNNASRLKRN